MSAESVALDHYRQRAALTDAVGALAAQVWARVDPADLDGSWARVRAQLLVGVAGAQLAAARPADAYADAELREQNARPGSDFAVVADALAGIASDGRPLDSLLRNAILTVKGTIARGATVDRAMAAGYANLDMLARTQVADAGRAADGVAIVARPQVTGYRRMLVGKSCSRCVILAGRWYEFNQGFDRHPRCDCIHVPAAESLDDVTTNPKTYFDSLSEAEQDATFTKAGAQAIRDGADMGRVVNARRGMYEAGGQKLTTEAAGKKPRLMPEAIYRQAKDRDDAIRLLERNGYIARRKPATRPAPKPPTFGERVQAGVTDRQRLGGGATARTERVTLADGSTAIYKRASDNVGTPAVDQQDAEELGALVARAVGLRAPEVYRASRDEVYMTLMPGEVADELAEDVLRVLRDSDEGSRLGLADLLMGNFDRNGGNLLVSGGRIAAIDHGAAFQWYPGINQPDLPPQTSTTWFRRFVNASGDEWADNPLSRADVETLRRRLRALRPEFARLNRSDWFEGMMGRLAAVARYANGRGLL